MYKDMEEQAYYSEQSKRGGKEVKPAEKKGRGQPKPKSRLPYEDNVLSDDEDFKNLDDVDPNLDNLDFIKNCAENNKRISVTENCFVFDKQNLPAIKTHKKNPELFEFIRINLIKSPVFSELNFDVLKNIIDAMEEKNVPAVTDVVKQGDLEESFYFVAEGQLECKMQFTQITQEGNRKKVEKFEPKLVRIYNPGDYFGELSLLYHTPRRGTIRAITDVKLYTLNRSTYKLILRKANEEKTEKIINAMKGVKILSMLEDEELEKLESITKEAVYSNGEMIIKENEFSNTLMILEKGKCIGTKTEEKGKTPIETSKYKDGDVLFEKAILRPEKSEENILASSDVVKFICVDRNGLRNNLGQYENILMRNMELYQEIFPPEEEKKDEEEEKRKEEEKKKEEEEKKKKEEEERKKKEEEENKISPEEEMKIIKEQHEKEIDDYKKLLKEQEDKYQQLLAKMQQQQNNFSNTNTNIQDLPNNINSNINTINNMNNVIDNNMNQFSNNDLNNNNIPLQSGLNGNDMNQFGNMGNNMNNLDINQLGDNNMMNQEPRMKVELRDDRKEEDKVEDDKESNRSNPMLLKEKIIYNDNDINAQMNNQKDVNVIDPNAGGGYMAEA
jgi:CRP-like cAMP-binding protein